MLYIGRLHEEAEFVLLFNFFIIYFKVFIYLFSFFLWCVLLHFSAAIVILF